MKRYFIGPKQYNIDNSDFFDGSITLFGNSQNGNISYAKEVCFEYWNPDNNAFEAQIYQQEVEKICEEIEVMAHNPSIVAMCDFPKNIHLICKNDDKILTILNNKLETRKLFEKQIPILNYINILGKDFDYDQLSFFSEKLVVQLPTGSGGAKTYLVTEQNHKEIKEKLEKNAIYTISIYEENNTPYNIHCIIGQNDIILFPPSIQELEIIDKIEYVGSFYDIEIEEKILTKFSKYCSIICKKLQSIGYRGVLGIDFIYTRDELFFIEINPRFQGSTRALDKILKEANLPSIYHYNYNSFYGGELPSTKNLKNAVK